MKYCIITDKEDFILQIKWTNNPIKDLYELNLADYDFSGNRKYCWKLIGNYKTEYHLEFDEAKFEYLESLEEPIRKAMRITELKGFLNDTDYIMARTVEELLDCKTLAQMLLVFANTIKKYSTVIIDRKAWRKEIEELEGE